MKFDFHKFIQVVGLVGPIVLVSVPGGAVLAPLVGVVIHAITTAELKGGTGEEKLARAQAIIADGVQVANATGKVKLNPEEVRKVANDGITAVIGTIHVIEGAKVVKQPGQ